MSHLSMDIRNKSDLLTAGIPSGLSVLQRIETSCFLYYSTKKLMMHSQLLFLISSLIQARGRCAYSPAHHQQGRSGPSRWEQTKHCCMQNLQMYFITRAQDHRLATILENLRLQKRGTGGKHLATSSDTFDISNLVRLGKSEVNTS